MKLFVILVLMLCVGATTALAKPTTAKEAAQKVPSVALSPEESQRVLAETRKFDAESLKLIAEQDEIKVERQKLASETNKLEEEATYYRRLPLITTIQVFAGVVTLSIPLFLGFSQLKQQREAVENRAELDACLKTAEIAMSAPNTSLVKSRAGILAVMFERYLPDFSKQIEKIDPYKVGLGSWRERFAHLLDGIANNPEDALLIAKSYRILYPDDDAEQRKNVEKLIEFLERDVRA